MTLQYFQFEHALVEGRWMARPVIGVNRQTGFVVDVRTESQAADGAGAITFIPAVALPGMSNCHSHAFQRGFAGCSEFRTGEGDSFWTWRRAMFDFLIDLTPDDVFRWACRLYQQMLDAGYTWVGEFHYLHNDPNGNRYSDPFVMADRLLEAAQSVGIGISLLPVLYQRGGFQDEPLAPGQRRFALTAEQYIELFDHCWQRSQTMTNVNVGVALHSLRAVGQRVGNEVLDDLKRRYPSFPIHIHVAEQFAEVEACQSTHGLRSVEYLLRHFPVDERWCLIHATHIDDGEIAGIVSSRAIVGLCPTTEANLGDGVFPARAFLDAGGRIAIGSDSHVSIDPREELRLLEYGQRLVRRERAVLGTLTESVGRRLYEATARGGAESLGNAAAAICVGARADWTLIMPSKLDLQPEPSDRILDQLIFCNHGDSIWGTAVGGKIQQRRNGEP